MKKNTFFIVLSTVLFLAALIIYYTSFFDGMILIILSSLLFISFIFAFGGFTASAKVKYSPLFLMGVSTIGFFGMANIGLFYATLYHDFVYPFSMFLFKVMVFALSLITALCATFLTYTPTNENSDTY